MTAAEQRSARLALVDELRGELARDIAPLERHHGARLTCKIGCSDCCVDDLTVFEAEAEVIVARHPDVLRTAPHPAGACAFLDGDGGCRIYADRPYVCRTQGLPLRWLEPTDHLLGPDSAALDGDGTAERTAPGVPSSNPAAEADDPLIERRDICEKNEAGPALVALSATECFELGPFEGRLATLEVRRAGGFDRVTRVRLRDLFRTVTTDPPVV